MIAEADFWRRRSFRYVGFSAGWYCWFRQLKSWSLGLQNGRPRLKFALQEVCGFMFLQSEPVRNNVCKLLAAPVSNPNARQLINRCADRTHVLYSCACA